MSWRYCNLHSTVALATTSRGVRIDWSEKGRWGSISAEELFGRAAFTALADQVEVEDHPGTSRVTRRCVTSRLPFCRMRATLQKQPILSLSLSLSFTTRKERESFLFNGSWPFPTKPLHSFLLLLYVSIWIGVRESLRSSGQVQS